jgi:hypothetical protein
MPVNDKLHISFSKPPLQAGISIYSLNGEKLYSSQINISQGEIDLSKYPAGVYLLKVISAEGHVSINKIVKK